MHFARDFFFGPSWLLGVLGGPCRRVTSNCVDPRYSAFAGLNEFNGFGTDESDESSVADKLGQEATSAEHGHTRSHMELGGF